jgi:adenine-specific DNA-methyltransferase
MKLNETLENQLKKEPNYVTDIGELKKWVVINKAKNYDAELIGLLLDDKELKVKFFIDVKGVLVFNQSFFIQFLEQKNYLNDSYTAYKNKVGLTIDGKFLKQRNEVALVWPFKDCVLEGGQSSEEDKREEIFFNETLAQDEITQLLEPKVLTNAKRYTSKGEKPLEKFNRNKNGIITDNLIIKGNNLLGLHSLKEEFYGQVKLIYIDPPYNTGNDGFNYNDRFNQSTWLTFMKNRLEVARQLLSEDGAIYVNLDFNQVHFAKVLMDEIFGNENFQREIIWRIGWLSGYKTIDKNFIRNHDSILFYSKNNKNLNFIKKYINNESFKPLVKYEKIKDKLTELGLNRQQQIDLLNFINHTNRPEKYPIEDVWNGNEYDDLNSIAIVSFSGETVSKMLGTPELKGQKSEKLIQRIIEAHTNENDIVLDYHLGTGTTAAVANKMKRQFIGVEQMDYIETIAVERLKKVIEGEQSGISKAVNWTGGGEFVYFELKKSNQNFIEQVESAKDTKTVLKIWEEMKTKSFLNYNVDLQKQEAHIEEFKALTLEEQKQHLVELLDKNQLYVNLSSLNDKDFIISSDEKKVTEDFYQIKK